MAGVLRGSGSGQRERGQTGKEVRLHAAPPVLDRTWTTCIMPACMW
jgi:hypothetical protein